jgi:tyrosine-specific transport protein
VLQLEALLIAEVNLQCHETALADMDSDSDPHRVITLTDMTRMTLGAPAEATVSAIYLTMTFTLLLAYTSRAGGLIDSSLHLPLHLGPALFTGSLGGMIAMTGSAGATRAASVLTVGMLAAFGAVVGQGATQVDWAHGLQHADWGAAAPCLPVMFLALVYHDLIPVVCQLLGWDRRKVKSALVLGSVLPGLMFVAWEAVCLGLVPYTPGLVRDPVDVLIQQQGGFAGAAIALFSIAALATSAIGVTLSVSSFFKNQLSNLTTLGTSSSGTSSDSCSSSSRSTSGSSTGSSNEEDAAQYTPSVLDCAAVLLTLVPPTVASAGDTNIFLLATHLAGAYGMTLLYGVLPPALAWAARERRGATTRGARASGRSRRLLAGGKPVLLGLVGAGVVIEGVLLSKDLPGLQPEASAVVQPVFDVASSSLSSVSATASQWASVVPVPILHVLNL